ncbi:hypothetical protein [Hyphomicrobium methylovorum]|uniref:hypothetical protein n=1 Tax=Hyphomicrobium methylovorum TaxID=84 RepID=UPI0015E63CD7|nr:hypothetical protein [Hyphomicrobium methylovorum]
MREPEEMGWFQVDGEDGFPRACNGVKRLMPEGSIEITEDVARKISDDVRARAPQMQMVSRRDTGGSAPVDLQPIQDQIDALKQTVIGQARAIDAQDVEVKAVNTSLVELLKGQKKLGGGGGA